MQFIYILYAKLGKITDTNTIISLKYLCKYA